MELKVNGVYSKESVQFFKRLKVKNYGLDFRPKSFSFLQLKLAKEIIELADTGEETFSFIFDTDKDFVVLELLSNILGSLPQISDRIFLEFEGAGADVDFQSKIKNCLSFKQNFIWNAMPDQDIKSLFSASSFLRVLNFDANYLETLQTKGELFKLAQQLKSYLSSHKTLLSIKLSNLCYVPRSIFDFLSPALLTLEMGTKLEQGYRKPDYPLIENYLNKVMESTI